MRILKNLLLLFAAISLTSCVNLEPRPDLSRSFTLGLVDVSDVTNPLGGEPPVANSLDLPAVYVMRPQIPGYIDAKRIQFRDIDGELSSVKNALWAEPLSDGIARAFAEYLADEGELHGVHFYPWPESGGEMTRVALNFFRFDASSSGAVYVSVGWTVIEGDGERTSGHFERTGISWNTSAPESLVSAYNRVLQELAGEVSQSLY